jgi:carotenoid cleavage dioxygenase
MVHETSIDLPKPVMIHDIAISENYSLILDMPVTFSIDRALKGGMAFDWEPSNGARIGVLPRHGAGSDIRWFEVELGYVFHCFNAFEEGDEVVLDACRTPRTRILVTDEEEVGDDQKARYHQYRFNLKTGAVTERRVNEIPLEFSRINEGYNGVRNRYGYACRFSDDRDEGTLFSAVLKYDRDQDDMQVLELGKNIYTNEFVFAPRTDSRSEDDGYVVGLVRDENRQSSECWVIDAQKFSQGPVARVRIPTRVPYGFHSNWVSAKDIAAQQLHLAA